jgi:drug/metabolite transporter (DMT)-like permease
MAADHDHGALGIVLVLGSAVAFSTAGLFTRLIDLDIWTVLFWRGLFGGLFIGTFIVVQQRGRVAVAFRSIGAIGLLAAACSTAATICFVNAFRLTTVADVMLINAAMPLATAAIAWTARVEAARPRTLAAAVVALAGVGLMFGAAGAAGNLVGNLLALAMTILIAGMMVIIRGQRDTCMLPAACLSAFACAVVVLPVSEPGAAGGMNLFLLVLFGILQFGLGLLLVTIGTRLIPATQAALIGLLDVPLAMLWVWIAVDEAPSLVTCAGGALVMAAVLGDLLRGRAGRHRSSPPLSRFRSRTIARAAEP